MNVLISFLGTAGLFAFWAVVIFVIPAYVALFVASWFPQTGQWRKRWAARRRRSRWRGTKSWWRSKRPRRRWVAGLIMGVMTAVIGFLIGLTGYTRSTVILQRRPEPFSWQESLGVGIVTGVAVFVLYTFRRWPHSDIWGRQRRDR